MSEFAFLIFLTFASGSTHQFKQVQCADMKCVEAFQEDARRSTTLTRFRVFERGRDGINGDSRMPYWPPVIDWSPQ